MAVRGVLIKKALENLSEKQIVEELGPKSLKINSDCITKIKNKLPNQILKEARL